MVKSLGFGIEARFDISKPFAPSQLREDHANELLTNSEMPHPHLDIEALRQTREGLTMNQIENLREDVSAGIHPERKAKRVPRNSNPSHPISLVFLLKTTSFEKSKVD
jgi:hypothetical protein